MRAATINFKGHSECIRTLSISPDCNYIASGGDDSLVKVSKLNIVYKELLRFKC